MCLVFMALSAHPGYPLIVAANRDEFHARETAAAAPWTLGEGHAVEVVAGRDLVAGGTWMGVSRAGRFAALTNYRGPVLGTADPPSRGALVTEFLGTEESAAQYCERLRADGHRYNGFSLVAYDGVQMCCYSNRADALTHIGPGVHGLSNHLLNTPWPKVARGREILQRQLGGNVEPRSLVDPFFDMLNDARIPKDYELPDTGVGMERERALAPMFVRGGDYGTRSSTIVMLSADGEALVQERTFDSDTRETGRVEHSWDTTVTTLTSA